MRKGEPIDSQDNASQRTVQEQSGLMVTVESPSFLQVAGVLDLATREALETVLSGLSASVLHLDVSQLEFVDAAGLAVLVRADAQRRRECGGQFGRILLHHPRPRIRRTVMVAGLEHLLARPQHAQQSVDWRSQAKCREAPAAVFFDYLDPMPARRLCWSCPVSGRCLGYALRTSQAFGVWGGLTARERSVLQRGNAGSNARRST